MVETVNWSGSVLAWLSLLLQSSDTILLQHLHLHQNFVLFATFFKIDQFGAFRSLHAKKYWFLCGPDWERTLIWLGYRVLIMVMSVKKVPKYGTVPKHSSRQTLDVPSLKSVLRNAVWLSTSSTIEDKLVNVVVTLLDSLLHTVDLSRYMDSLVRPAIIDCVRMSEWMNI